MKLSVFAIPFLASTILFGSQSIAQTEVQKSLQLRSVSYISSKLEKLGFGIQDAHRIGQIYVFSSSKNGTTDFISVDARNAEIVGLNVLKAADGVAIKSSGSEGNHYVDENYEFGYSVAQADFDTMEVFAPEDLASPEVYTSAPMTESDIVIYGPTDAAVGGIDNLDQGDDGDAEGNALANMAFSALPDYVAEDAVPPEPDASPDEPSDDEIQPEDVPADEDATPPEPQ